ncbi:MAG: LptF/LptG family permease [Candidatus Fermentibacteria bacterium]|nr:LptF/LptG family permease [Candidatus Fermentibacteria bacterium]
MKLLDRYLAGRFVKMIFMTVLSFTVIFVTVNAFDHFSRWMDKNVTAITFMRYYFYGLPYIIILVTPIAVLICSLLLVAGMAKNNELTAMRASGVSIPRIFIPLLFVGFIISVFTLVVGDFVVADANYLQMQVKRVEIDGRDPINYLMRNDFAHRTLDGAIVEIGLFDGQHSTISRAVVEWFDDSLRVLRRVDAQRLTYIDSVWTGISAEERLFSPSGEMSFTLHDTLYIHEISDTPEDFGSRRKSAAEMNVFELWDHIGRVRGAGGNPTGDLVEFWLTLFFPFSALIMVLVGAPLATSNPRSGKSTSIGLAVLLGFIFFSLARFGQTLGHKGALEPILAAALPEVVFIILGFWLFRRAGQQ